MRLFTARWVCPVATPPIENGCVAVSDAGEIAFVGSRSGAPEGELHSFGNALLLPGLINAHSHLDLTVLRGAISTSDFFAWIRTLVELKAQFLDESVLLASARMGLAEGIRAGITTYADTSDSNASFRAMRELGARGIAYLEVFGPDPRQCQESMSGLRARVQRLRSEETPLVRVGISPHAPYTVSDDLYRDSAAFAIAEGLPLAVHIAESAAESDYVANGSGPFAELLRGRGIDVRPRAATPIELLRRTGVLDAAPLLIHAVNASESDLAIIKSSRAAVVHCPVSNARFGHRRAPLLRFFEEGIATAIGTDSMVANNRMDLLEEARTAALLAQAGQGRGDLVSASQLLWMLTMGGAGALGLEQHVGSLEAGKRADMVVFSLGGAHTQPAIDPHETAIHALRGSDAEMVMVDGKEIFRENRHAVDLSRDGHIAGAVADKLRQGRH